MKMKDEFFINFGMSMKEHFGLNTRYPGSVMQLRWSVFPKGWRFGRTTWKKVIAQIYFLLVVALPGTWQLIVRHLFNFLS